MVMDWQEVDGQLIDKGTYGPCLILQGKLDDYTGPLMERLGTRELFLNEWNGWEVGPLAPLRELEFLEGVGVLTSDSTIEYSPLYDVPGLKEVSLQGPIGTPIHVGLMREVADRGRHAITRVRRVR